MPLIQHYSLAQDECENGVKYTADELRINGRPVNKFLTDTSGNTVGPSDREPYGRYYLNNDEKQTVILESGEQEFLETDGRHGRRIQRCLNQNVARQLNPDLVL